MAKDSLPDVFWPHCLRYLGEAYLSAHDEYVVIAEIRDLNVNGFRGTRILNSCLVPRDSVDAVLQVSGGIGHKVESWGPHPIVPPEGGWNGTFWVRNPHEDTKYEALVHTWLNHNRTVLLPDTAFLMCYGLVPRLLGADRMAWDDPRRPIYDVAELTPQSIYDTPNSSHAYIRLRRDYLEDYASLKGSAVLAVYYEEQYCRDDEEIREILGDREAADFKLPGRLLCLRRIDFKRSDGANQLAQVWGTRLILKPSRRPITDEKEPNLTWPDGVTLANARPLQRVFVRDSALKEWEDRPEYSVYPQTGDVSYGGWWGTSRSHRIARHFIAVELAKLHEGTPPYVIQHFHRYAVSEADVERDRAAYGDLHIGQRATDVVEKFFGLIRGLTNLSRVLGQPYEDDELCGISEEYVRYHGWWTLDGFKRLGRVIPLEMPRDEFLGRCVDLYQILERLKPGPLKRLLVAMGMREEDLKPLATAGALRYLATIFQLAETAQELGCGVVTDFETIREHWDPERRVALMAPIFALNGIRNIHSHVQGQAAARRWEEALKIFQLNENAMSTGWGLGLDAVYDSLCHSFIAARGVLDRTSY